MCGIAGFFNYASTTTETSPEILQQMTRSLAHRGPDEEGYVQEKLWGFGHRRLQVIDLEGGKQPMVSQDRKITLAYNGEIYNFQKIRERLERTPEQTSHNGFEETL